MADRYWITTSGTTNGWGNTNNWSTTSGGSGGASVPTSSDNAIFDQAGTYTAVISDARSVNNLTISAGTVTINLSTVTTSTFTIGGNVDFTGSASGTNITGLASATGIIFATTTGTNTVNLQGRNIANTPIQIGTTSTTTGSLQLTGTFSSSTTTAKITHLKGNLDLNNNVLYCFWFTSTANSRNIDFGTSGYIQVNGTSFPQINITVTGNPTATGNALFVINCGASSAQAIIYFRASIAFATQSGGLDFLPNATNGVTNLDFTNFSGTWAARASAYRIYGNLTLSTGMTSAASTGVMTFGATSGTQIITSNGKALNQPVNINGIGGTVQLADALNMGSTALSLLNGTFDGNNKTITGTSSFTMLTGSVTMQNVSTAVSFTHTSGTLTQGGANTVAAYAFTAGTLDLSSYQLNATTFTSSNANTRTIAFGTGNITLTGTGAVWNTFTNTGLSTTGTQVVNVANATATAASIAPGPLSEANSISFNITTGSYALTSLSNSNYFRSLNFQGFTGTAPISGTTGSVYKDLNLGSTISSFGTSGTTVNFIGTTTQTVTNNGKTFNSKIIVNNVGGTVLLADALTQVSTVDFALQSGNLDLNGKTLTVGAVVNGFATYLTGTKSITFNGGTLVCPFAGVAFNNAVPTGFTTSAGTGTGTISFTAATAKSFTGGGSTYNCTVSNDGAGELTIANANTINTVTTTSGNVAITGSNTITTITNAVQPVTFTFTPGTTQTITNWNVNGTAGNLVTIQSASAASHTLSKTGGIVSANYLSISRSTATGGAAWYAGTTSTNGGNNSGWIFTAPPAGNYTITALNGSYAINGQSIGIYRNRSLTSAYGSYSLAGQSIGIYRNRSLTSNYGSYAITGQSATLSRGFLLSSQNGLYSITGQAIDITYTPTPPVTGPMQYFIEIRSFTQTRRI